MATFPCMKCAKAVPASKRPGGYTVEARDDGKAHLVKDGVTACANAPEEPEEIIERLAAKVEELKTVLRQIVGGDENDIHAAIVSVRERGLLEDK